MNSHEINISAGDQPELVRQFSYNLKNSSAGGVRVTQVIQPWMTYGLYKESPQRPEVDQGFLRNIGTNTRHGTGLERQHFNHLHVSFGW